MDNRTAQQDEFELVELSTKVLNWVSGGEGPCIDPNGLDSRGTCDPNG